MSAAQGQGRGGRWHALVERLSQFEVPPRLRRPLRLLGYPAFAVLVALISFAVALPRDKIKERLEYLCSQDPLPSQPLGLGMDVKAGDLSLSVLGRGIEAKNVVLRTRPSRATDKPARFVLDSVEIKVGLFGLVLQRPTYSFLIEAWKGLFEGSIRMAGNGARYDISAKDIALGAIQGLQTVIGGLPLEGKLEGKLDLDAPGRLLATSNGSLELNIDGASVGDGKAKLVVPNDPFLAGGLTVPQVRLGKINAIITVEKGRARIDSFRSHSADGDITIEGYLDLRDPIALSQLHLFLRVRLSEDLLKRESTLGLLINTIAPGKRPDGFYGAQLSGTFSTPHFQADKNPPPGVTSKFAADGAAAPAGPSAPAAPAAPTPSAPPLPAPGPSAVPPSGTVPPPPPPDAPTPPVEIPPTDKPQPQPKDGVILPPPPVRGSVRVQPGADGTATTDNAPAPPPLPPPPSGE